GRILVEPRAPRVDRPLRVLEHRLAELPEPPKELAPRLGVVLELHLDAQDARELRALACARVDPLERAGAGERDGRVFRRELEHLPVNPLGARAVVELIFVDLRNL